MDASTTVATRPPLTARPLGLLTRAITALPRTTLLVCLLLALASLAIAFERLTLRTDRLDLLSPQSRYNRLWLEYIREFGEADDVVVVVSGAQPGEVQLAMDRVARRLSSRRGLFRNVLHRVDTQPLAARALYYLPQPQLAQLSEAIEQASTAAPQQSASAVAGLEPLLQSLQHVEENLFASGTHLTTPNGQIGFVTLHLARPRESMSGAAHAIDNLRAMLAGLQPDLPNVTLGLTGLPVIESDEMRLSARASTSAGVLSAVGVGALFAAALGGIRVAVAALFALALGIAWTLGYLTLAVGHLNILSMAFGVILIGLGIDFAIHYLTCFLSARCEQGTRGALEATASTVGPGIVTGSATTACAFFTAGLTRFTGVAELGVIAGGGILLCAAATLIVLPAMILLGEKWLCPGEAPRPGIIHWLAPLYAWPRGLLAVVVVISASVATGIPGLSYDHNLLNLLPDSLPSAAWERTLLAQTDRSLWFAISVCDDADQLRARKQQFARLPAVERVEDIVSLLPDDAKQKEPLVRKIAANVPLAIARSDTAAASLQVVRRCATARPPGWQDLPDALVSRFLSDRGRHVLRVYGRGDIWNEETLERFVTEVRLIDPAATGKPLQTYEASREMQQSYLHAALYAFFAILILLILDFWSVRAALLALVPVALGMLQMFGLLGMANIALNPANLIVLPLILGIGIDDGVHVMHDFRRQVGPYRLSRSTATAVLVTSLTTMIGFGSLMIAPHRGLASLGRVLVIGVACCLLTSLIALPALLSCCRRLGAPSGEKSAPAPTPAEPTAA